MLWKYIVCALAGYLVCNINVAVIIGKMNSVNLRTVGSKNPGASNAFISIGPGAGAVIAFIDVFKAAGLVFAARLVFPDTPYIDYLTAISCLIGNVFPCFHKFRGGKGFATFLGMVLAVNWQFFLILLAVVALITITTGYIVYGTFFSIIAYPVYLYVIHSDLIPFLIAVAVSVLIIIRHHENIKSLFKGEPLLRKAFTKK